MSCPGQTAPQARGLHLQDLSLSLGGAELVRLTARIAPGEVLTVMGASGSGKSSLLAAIAGALPPAFRMTGRITLQGHDLTGLPPEARRIGILFQDDLLFPHLSVGGNLMFGLRMPGAGRRDRQAAVAAALESVGLAGFASRDPATLSGGQRARVSLMRMLLSDPCALLLDEPFSRLDQGMRDQTRALVFALARDRGLPVVLVTHDIEDARAASGPVLGPLGQPVAV